MQQGSLAFAQRLNGRFDGMVRQKDAERLAEAVAHWDGWYLVEPQADMPEQAVEGTVARQHLEGLLQEILREERGVWSTMVYVQSMEDPWIIKIFHPRRAGCGCGGGGDALPWWILSRVKPEAGIDWQPNVCATPSQASGRVWWKKWF